MRSMPSMKSMSRTGKTSTRKTAMVLSLCPNKLLFVAKRSEWTETPLALTRRARRINSELALLYPHAHCELDFTNALELSVATILSAQCTDKKVNEVTRTLFGRYKVAADYAAADRAELEELIRPTGFFRNKTSSLIKLGQQLADRFGG